MELLHLKYFVAVAECGSFSAAAATHKIAQPKISRYVRSLEEVVGTALFYRNGRGADLTEAGSFLLQHSYEMLDMSNRIRAGIQSITGSPGGEVVVGLPSTISAIVTLEIIDRIRNNNPRVELSIREAASDHIHEWLSTGQIDVAVLVDAPASSTLLSQRLAEERLYLAGKRERHTRFEDLALQDLVQGQTVLIPGTARSIARYREDVIFAEATLLPLDCLAAAVDFIRQDRGFAILPASYSQRMVEGRFAGEMALRELPHRRTLSLATSSQRSFTPAVSIVADEVARCVRRATRITANLNPTEVIQAIAA